MKYANQIGKDGKIITLEENQKYVECVSRGRNDIQIITCGLTDFEKMALQATLRMNSGTVNYFIWPYINFVEAEA